MPRAASRSTGGSSRLSNRRWQPSDEPDELVYAVCVRFLEQLHKKQKSTRRGENKSAEASEVSGRCADEDAAEEDAPRGKSKRKSRGKAAQRGGATEIAEWLKEHWGRKDLNRERVYPLISEGVRRGFLLLSPPLESALAEQIVRRFGINQPGQRRRSIHVVNVRGRESSRHVTSAAADLVHKLIYQIAETRRRNRKASTASTSDGFGSSGVEVHLGLGGGLTTSMFTKRLARRIYSDRSCPELVLHSLSAGGFSVDQPERSPVTYIS